ncbi:MULTISPECIES: 2,6-dihydroxypyridine 3-hydroxylase subunit NdhB [unclassified Arthrobacter]|uniref:2,6-dihydroxypyridine 3-hydroxylase subunit NdhB n=1 Tax=Micrococcaceae TaxID=1268 RepID=UPI0012EEFB1C|nr:2,6-dihydroxypyridine 3-hydroxylase subunit NdhB [Arthrobacter sp. 8AJ]VXB95384.1 xanthine dehydrogenase, iron-sulfur subunit [Arthrobacter sp. 8AJ]
MTSSSPSERVEIDVEVNGRRRTVAVDARDTLADHLRNDQKLTGIKLGCEHGVCGACTILMDGAAVRSCLTLAAQGNGRSIRTVEDLSDGAALSPLQEAFKKHHALQCGFCTAGFLISATELLDANPSPTKDEVVEALSGNLCRCTGYQTIVEAVLDAAGQIGN